MEILTRKLNKYLIQIITDYAIINYNKIFTDFSKTRIQTRMTINEDLTIEDIIIKSYQLGFGGFRIPINYIFHEYLDSICNNLVEIVKDKYWIYYKYKNEKLNLHMIDIFELNDVIIKKKKSIINILPSNNVRKKTF
jgi:hypothetical protein